MNAQRAGTKQDPGRSDVAEARLRRLQARCYRRLERATTQRGSWRALQRLRLIERRLWILLVLAATRPE